MILPLHIIIALSSIIYTGYVYFAPSRTRLRASYALAALTLASGAWLAVGNSAHMVQSCLTGIVYLSVIFVGIYLAGHKLAAIAAQVSKRR